MNAKLIALYIFDQILSVAVVGVVLFWSAGRIDWWAAWVAMIVWLVLFAAMDIFILRINPGLIAERLRPPKSAKTWDKVIVSILRLTELARYILAGLDQRNGWTTGFPVAAQIVAVPICVLSYALFIWAMAANPFFSQVIRIQSDRGHVVATAGPYRYVRHPGYAGMVVFEVAMSTLLGSWWAILAGLLCSGLIILRTALEDRTLQAELPGYAEYARQVRYRLVPGVW
jgi:protein-S-isoprenylcysteine O-methyltransferase Ste14